ncbi:MAG: Aminodeoxychorismate lyase [Candidatus Tokpelaia sp. JSC189]|nr:MAG: Aminodeoxychorismate lyase [Candidatus Tokpelaia sp. JSC189]
MLFFALIMLGFRLRAGKLIIGGTLTKDNEIRIIQNSGNHKDFPDGFFHLGYSSTFRTDNSQYRNPEEGDSSTGGIASLEQASVNSNNGYANRVSSDKSKRSKIARNQAVVFANFIFTVLLFVASAFSISFYFIRGMFEVEGPSKEAHIVLIKPGTGIRKIATMLQTEGIIKNSQIFIYSVNWSHKAKQLKTGEYEIPARASMRQIMDIMVLGRSIEHSFTVPEGLTVKQVFERLAENGILVGSLPEKLPPEGTLMTDTVRFVRGTSREEIVKRLRDGQTRLVEEIWKGRKADLPLQNINELVTLASIVEKETGIASERPLIAAVFHNRLKKKMRLQSDPTVIYGLFGSSGKPANRPIYRSDLEQETPFNTYKINGLPPSPIANPGRDSLRAVANPPHTEDLYFVANGTGGHVFSKTLNEHNINVQRWRTFRKNQDSFTEKEKV